METLAESQDSEVDAPAEHADAQAPDMLDRVMQLFMLSEENQSSSDLDSFGLVLEKLAYAADLARRAELSNQLSAASAAPNRLMRRMAFDNILVARPVLQYSECLSEGDLETLASKLDQDYLLAIAHRLKLSTRVTDILVDRGDAKVHRTATANAGAEFSKKSVAKLYRLAEGDAELLESLGQRPDLNPGIVRRLSTFVSKRVIDELKQIEIRIDSGQAEPGDAVAVNDADDAAEPDTSSTPVAQEDGEAPAGAEPMTRDGEDADAGPPRTASVSEKTLAQHASSGMLDETVACMATLTKMDEPMVRHCLLNAELSALMVMCKATGFANVTFKSLLTLRNANSDNAGMIEMTQTLQRYDAMQSDTAKRIVQYAQKKNA